MELRDFLHSPAFLSFTIGVPFCIFKILFGLLAIRVGELGSTVPVVALGSLVIIWASADLVMNLIRAAQDLAGRENQIEFCTLAQAGRILGAPGVFLALDTLITFSIICFVLWSGWVMHFSRYESYLWYFATTLNLISLSLVGLWTELSRFRSTERGEH
jgi:hypothetical protein